LIEPILFCFDFFAWGYGFSREYEKLLFILFTPCLKTSNQKTKGDEMTWFFAGHHHLPIATNMLWSLIKKAVVPRHSEENNNGTI